MCWTASDSQKWDREWAGSFSVHRCYLLYKLLYKIRRSPRWINDLHSRFIVWANMKYFSFLIWFRLCTVHSSLYMFKCLFANSCSFHRSAYCFWDGYMTKKKEEKNKHRYKLNLYDCKRTRESKIVCVFKWTMKIRFLRFTVSVLCRMLDQSSRNFDSLHPTHRHFHTNTRYKLAFYVRRCELPWPYIWGDIDVYGSEAHSNLLRGSSLPSSNLFKDMSEGGSFDSV